MLSCQRLLPFTIRFISLLICAAQIAAGAPGLNRHDESGPKTISLTRSDDSKPDKTWGATTYSWNVNTRELPLLDLPGENLKRGIDQTLSYPIDRFNFPIFQPLAFDEEHDVYLLPSLSSEGNGIHFVEFAHAASGNTYTSEDGKNIILVDNNSLKTFRTKDGSKYNFVRYPDGEFRCASIRDANGASVNLLYAANGLALRGIVDSSGRTVRFDYANDGITSVTQTWMAKSEGLTRTWAVGDVVLTMANSLKFSHTTGLMKKMLPTNAVVREYTDEMAASDRMLARVFGSSSAVAAGNGFEPAGLAASYPFYRGDIIGDDGKLRRGHLSCALHLYGSADGVNDSALYVPAGFGSHSSEPSPTDAAVTFYYPRLGNLTDVTLAVFHVADFHITTEEGRVRIGNIGGPGGAVAFYKHSHIEFYRGNTGLPAAADRARLRIDPATVFESSGH